jgi:putative PIN family toxin of toxin-antitoxin system
MKAKSRIILETNVIISALLREKSPARKVFDKANAGGEVLVSTSTMLELYEVIRKPKFDKYISLERRTQFIAAFLASATQIDTTSIIDVCRDPKDNRFLELAIDGHADYMVSGDDDLLVLHPYQVTKIVTPTDFLALDLTESDEGATGNGEPDSARNVAEDPADSGELPRAGSGDA